MLTVEPMLAASYATAESGCVGSLDTEVTYAQAGSSQIVACARSKLWREYVLVYASVQRLLTRAVAMRALVDVAWFCGGVCEVREMVKIEAWPGRSRPASR